MRRLYKWSVNYNKGTIYRQILINELAQSVICWSYKNGSSEICTVHNGLATGITGSTYRNGNIKTIGYFKDSVSYGWTYNFYDDGNIHYIKNYSIIDIVWIKSSAKFYKNGIEYIVGKDKGCNSYAYQFEFDEEGVLRHVFAYAHKK